MKRKICSFLLAFLLLLALTPAALADGAQLSYITDDAGILTASETASLEKAAQHIAQRYGVMSVPTLILFEGGAPKRQMVGAQPKQNVLALFA